jgi:hypothetical protein
MSSATMTVSSNRATTSSQMRSGTPACRCRKSVVAD